MGPLLPPCLRQRLLFTVLYARPLACAVLGILPPLPIMPQEIWDYRCAWTHASFAWMGSRDPAWDQKALRWILNLFWTFLHPSFLLF